MLKNLRKLLESEQGDKSIFDIVIYGSIVKGKESTRDMDILIVFLEGTLRQRLDKLQTIKSKLKKKDFDKNLDIKQILLKELFYPEFLARTGIFLGGISIFRRKKFSETLGFMPYTLFWYNLKGLTHSQKVKFNYILAGRNMKGVIQQLDGNRLVNGAVKIPIENSITFEEILKNNKISYSMKNILEEI